MVSEQARRTSADARTKPRRGTWHKKFWSGIFRFQEGGKGAPKKFCAGRADGLEG
jgi:hypothetical protein